VRAVLTGIPEGEPRIDAEAAHLMERAVEDPPIPSSRWRILLVVLALAPFVVA